MASPWGASNYEIELASKASSPLLKDLRQGTVVFTQPAGPASCAGAAQKPMYLACNYWQSVSRSTVVFAEFDDQYRPNPTILFWKGLARERRPTWVLDRHILPWVYWNQIVKGRA